MLIMRPTVVFPVLISLLLLSGYGCGSVSETSIPTATPRPSLSYGGWVPKSIEPTPTQVSARPGLNILDAIAQGDFLVVEQHMDVGTDLDEAFVPAGLPWAGASALHLAVVMGNKEIVQILLDNGADIEIKAKDQPGGTPLQWIAFFGVENMAEFMVNAGADVNAKDNNGCTPLCATTVKNPFVKEADLETFDKARATIQEFLKSEGGRLD